MQYHVIDRDMGLPPDVLTAQFNAIGANGWWLINNFPIRFAQRRSMFKQVGGVVEYFIHDTLTGRSAQDAENAANGYGAQGWELVWVDLIVQNQRRVFYARGGSGGGGGTQGPPGPAGPAGPAGPPGPPGASTNTFEYLFDNKNLTPPPVSGDVVLNNADQTQATVLWVSYLTDVGNDASIFLRNITVANSLYLQDTNDSTLWQHYQVTADAIDQGTYSQIGISWINGGGSLPFGAAPQKIFFGIASEGGIGEAPQDGTTYGRFDQTWNPAVAKDNDVLDGGNF